MHAEIKGALQQLNISWKSFTHKGKKMTKEQVRKVLEYGIEKGYKTTAELSEKEVDKIIASDEGFNIARQASIIATSSQMFGNP